MNSMRMRRELEQRFQKDQESFHQKDWVTLESIYEQNAQWLKKIIANSGWPDERKVGEKGEQAAWLIVQHASDILFQEHCLQLLQHFPATTARLQYIAYLTDRILVSKEKPQKYGTQFHYGKPFPITDRNNLEERRKKMHLEPFDEYYRRMN